MSSPWQGTAKGQGPTAISHEKGNSNGKEEKLWGKEGGFCQRSLMLQQMAREAVEPPYLGVWKLEWLRP